MQDVVAWVDRNADLLTDMAKRIWENPELGLVEFQASELQVRVLREAGFDVTTGVGGMRTAIAATWGTGAPVVGFLGEFDALPGLSQEAGVANRRPIKAGGPGHGCGHNLLGTAHLGAALAVKAALEARGLPGTVRYYGCPAEESFNAKGFMAQAGAFDDVDVAFAFHPGDHTAADMASNLANSKATFTFHGVAAHAAAMPELGRSALDAVELMNVGVNYLREHVPSDVRIHYQILNGGGAPNVVPDLASSLYFVRARTRKGVDEAYARVVACAEGAALMTGTRVEVQMIDGLWNILANKVVAERLAHTMGVLGPVGFDERDRDLARSLQASFPAGSVARATERYRAHGWNPGGDDAPLQDRSLGILGEGEHLSGSTDAADVSRVAPTGFLWVATAPLGTPGHSWQNVAAAGSSIGMKGMLYATKTMAAAALDFVLDPALVRAARDEFEANPHREPYRLPLDELIPPPHVPVDAPWRAPQA